MKLLVFTVVKQNECILLIQEASAKWRGKWFFPGGKIDVGENIADAGIRETSEESGYHIKCNGIFFIEYFKGNITDDKMHLYLTGEIISGTLKEDANEHSLRAAWFSRDQIKNLDLRKNVAEVIDAYMTQPVSIMLSQQFVIKDSD